MTRSIHRHFGSLTDEGTAACNEANHFACSILESTTKDNRALTDYEVLNVLQLCGFRENTHRTSVLRENVKWVYSDTLGLVRFKYGQFMVADATQGWPGSTKSIG